MSASFRGLYAMVDVGALEARGVDPFAYAEALLGARPALLQVRAKALGTRAFCTLVGRLLPRAHAHDVPLVVNDRLDVARAAGATYLHVGQEDLPVEVARRLAPRLRIGVSTHDLAQLARALEARPDYVAYGPVFETRSKERPDPVVGVPGLRQAAKLARDAGIPLVAIGGVDLERARGLARDVSMVAVIGDLLPASSDASALAAAVARAKAFHSVFFVSPSGEETHPC